MFIRSISSAAMATREHAAAAWIIAPLAIPGEQCSRACCKGRTLKVRHAMSSGVTEGYISGGHSGQVQVKLSRHVSGGVQSPSFMHSMNSHWLVLKLHRLSRVPRTVSQ